MTEQNLKQLADLHDENIELKKEIERLKAEREWISVKDKLPEIGQVVDIWKHDKELSKSYRVTNFTFEKNIVINFTHWMPLPEPLKQ